MAMSNDGFVVPVPLEIVKLLREYHGSDDDAKNAILSLSMVALISRNNDVTLKQAAKLAKMSVEDFTKYMDDRNFDWRWYYNRKFPGGDENG